MTASLEVSAAVNELSSGRLPDFFIAGHAKSGTTALYEMLRTHPQIFMPAVKEPWYFVPELRSTAQRAGADKHPRTLDAYRALFRDAKPGQRAGEATPSYLFSHEAARRIAEVQPAARIVAILREPASFLRSLHMQFLQTGVETEPDLAKAVALEPLRREGKRVPATSSRPQTLFYSDHVTYVEQLQRYLAVFPPEQLLVLIYDDFRADNVATVRRVLRFLDLDDAVAIEQTEANPTVRVRSARTSGLVRSLYLGRGAGAGRAKRAIKTLTPRSLRHRAMAIERRAQLAEPKPADERTMRELRIRFADEVSALSRHLDRDLGALWGYDRLA
ncbi:MAG TPA: sulfotransferase [Solirubrobacteraceae bacterium]|nr:sulfotransferase [Solirubrobacteraceae bacterium]